MLESAEGGLPVVEPVIEPLHAFSVGAGLQGLAHVKDPVHAGGVPGAAELVQGLFGVPACAFGVAAGGFDGCNRKQIRPVIIGGAEVMDRLFPEDSPEAGPDASDA